MSRKRINAKHILSNAEKQARYRAKRKAELEALKAAALPSPAGAAPDLAAVREQIKQELKQSWEPELIAERIAVARKESREAARRADQSRRHGYIDGICSAAVFFIGKDRTDLAQHLLTHFMIDREKAVAVLEADKRTSGQRA